MRRYVTKLRQELEAGAAAVFAGASDRERVRSVLADLGKTSSDFAAMAGWALAAVASALASQLRCAPPLHWSSQIGSPDLCSCRELRSLTFGSQAFVICRGALGGGRGADGGDSLLWQGALHVQCKAHHPAVRCSLVHRPPPIPSTRHLSSVQF